VEGLASHLNGAAEDGHLLAVATVCGATCDFVLAYAELLGQSALQTGAVESGKRGHLTGLQTAIEQRDEAREVGGVEDDDDVLHVGAIGLDVLAEFTSNLAVALEEILAGHTLLTGSAAAGDDVLSILESLGHIGGGSEVDTVVTAVEHLFHHAFHSGSVDIVEAYVGRQLHGQRRLNHSGTDGTASAHNHKFVIGQKIHNSCRVLRV